MTQDKKTITLPEHDDMLRRLLAVEDDPHAQEQFYPLLLKSAGREQTGAGVVMMLTIAIQDYTEGMPPVVRRVVQMRIREYVVALVDDPEVQADALALLEKVEADVREAVAEKVRIATEPQKGAKNATRNSAI